MFVYILRFDLLDNLTTRRTSHSIDKYLHIITKDKDGIES